MRRCAQVVVAALVAILAAPAPAGTGFFDKSPSVAELRAAHAFGTCLAADELAADGVVAALPGAPSARSLSKSLHQHSCYPAGLSKPDESWVVRGAIFEARLKRKHPSATATFRGVGWVDYSYPEGLNDKKRRFDAKALVNGQMSKLMLEYADCIARSQPRESGALLEAPVASAEERQAAGALAPAFATCLAKGAKMGLRVWLFRAHLAEALFHLNEVRSGVPGLTKAEQ